MAEPHDAPSARELIESVREWIERDVAPAVSGRLQFHSRVAVNVLAMVERELEAGPVQAEAHAARLAALGTGSDAELAARIRAGAFDGRLAEVLDTLEPSIRDKVSVANPRYLAD